MKTAFRFARDLKKIKDGSILQQVREAIEEVGFRGDAMKRIGAIITLLFMGAALCRAQGQTVPDTLDWRLYYPLQIGNAWEYVDDNWPQTGYPRYWYEEVTGDTAIGQRRYFVMTRLYHDTETGNTSSYAAYRRYDDSLKAVVHLSTFDGKEESLAFGCSFAVPFPPDAGSSYTSACGHDGTRVGISGGYTSMYHRVGYDSVHVSATKTFCWAGPCVSYLYGIGDGGGPSEGGHNVISLRYVRIDGRDYGGPAILTSAALADTPRTRGMAEIFPNPVYDQVTIRFSPTFSGMANVTVFDVQGRRIWAEAVAGTAGVVQELQVQTKSWPAGVYVVRIDGGAGVRHVKMMALIK